MGDFRWTRPETVTYPGGASRTERYDALQRTRQITVRAGAETRMDWRYTYDPVGNISRIDTEHGRYSFGYDALDRLTEADYPNGPQHDQINASFAPGTFPFADDRYSYDPVGNRLSSQSQPGPWAYNGNSEKIQSPFGTRSYNAAGSTVEERTPTDQLIRRFVYDTEERPVEVTNAQGLRIARYYHDPFGRRLWKTLEPGAEGHSGGPGPETVYLAYSDEGYAAEFRMPGTPETAPTTGPASFTTIWVHEPDGLWSTGAIAIRIDGNWRYPQHDHLATPRMVIDGQGAVTTTIRMNAFGETRHQGEAIANRFPGQLYDAETGLHYNWFRSYEARAGRYTQEDPLRLYGGIGLYEYAYSDPFGVIDPTGEFGLAGAVTGGVLDFAAQMAENGFQLRCIDTTQLLRSVILGSVGWGIGGNLARTRQVRQAYQDALRARRGTGMTRQDGFDYRRSLGEKLKEQTPQPWRAAIYGRNRGKYNDSLGPPTLEAADRARLKDGKRPRTADEILTDTNRAANAVLLLPRRGMRAGSAFAASGGNSAASWGPVPCECR